MGTEVFCTWEELEEEECENGINAGYINEEIRSKFLLWPQCMCIHLSMQTCLHVCIERCIHVFTSMHRDID